MKISSTKSKNIKTSKLTLSKKERMFQREYFAETERLHLRNLSFADLGHFAKLLADPEIMKYSSETPTPFDQSMRILQNILADEKKYGFGACAIIHKETKEWIGFCGICWDIENGEVTTDFGYSYFKKFWGQGFATESIKACLKHIFQIIPDVTIYSYIERSNIASIRVAEKVGMKFVKEDIYLEVPVYVYKCVKNDICQECILFHK